MAGLRDRLPVRRRPFGQVRAAPPVATRADRTGSASDASGAGAGRPSAFSGADIAAGVEAPAPAPPAGRGMAIPFARQARVTAGGWTRKNDAIAAVDDPAFTSRRRSATLIRPGGEDGRKPGSNASAFPFIANPFLSSGRGSQARASGFREPMTSTDSSPEGSPSR